MRDALRFWKLDSLIKGELFRSQCRRTKAGAKPDESNDAFTKLFGTVIPRNIPESAAYLNIGVTGRMLSARPSDSSLVFRGFAI